MSLLAERFTTFANECDETSELYKNLSTRIAQDEEILRLAASSRVGQPQPNMLFGAAHYLLLSGKSNPLSRYYPSLTVDPESPEFAFPAFKKFVLSHEGEMSAILSERLVQTNEVQRSAYIYPSIATTYAFFDDRPISLIELGASAGFNLLWDQYSYRFNDNEPVGLKNSSLVLTSEWRGTRRPDLSRGFPKISRRVGVDLNPIDLMDKDQILWLQALIWPEHFERKARLNKAIRIAMVNPVEMIQGDAIETLQDLLNEMPASDIAYVYHTHMANQLSQEERDRLLWIVEEFGKRQDIVHIHNNIEPHIHATIYRNGERIEMPLAKSDGHANWIEWLA